MVNKTISSLKKAFGVTYSVSTICENCNSKTILQVPYGVLVYEFLEDGATCNNCGCRISRLISEELDPEALKKEHRKELMSLRERLKLKKEE